MTRATARAIRCVRALLANVPTSFFYHHICLILHDTVRLGYTHTFGSPLHTVAFYLHGSLGSFGWTVRWLHGLVPLYTHLRFCVCCVVYLFTLRAHCVCRLFAFWFMHLPFYFTCIFGLLLPAFCVCLRSLLAVFYIALGSPARARVCFYVLLPFALYHAALPRTPFGSTYLPPTTLRSCRARGSTLPSTTTGLLPFPTLRSPFCGYIIHHHYHAFFYLYTRFSCLPRVIPLCRLPLPFALLFFLLPTYGSIQRYPRTLPALPYRLPPATCRSTLYTFLRAFLPLPPDSPSAVLPACVLVLTLYLCFFTAASLFTYLLVSLYISVLAYTLFALFYCAVLLRLLWFIFPLPYYRIILPMVLLVGSYAVCLSSAVRRVGSYHTRHAPFCCHAAHAPAFCGY